MGPTSPCQTFIRSCEAQSLSPFLNRALSVGFLLDCSGLQYLPMLVSTGVPLASDAPARRLSREASVRFAKL